MATDSESGPSIQPAKTRILVVDDDPEIGPAMKAMLRREPFEIRFVPHACDAWLSIDSRPLDVLITDERMPEIAGSELIRLVHEFHPNVGRILMTGLREVVETFAASDSRHAERVLLKPFSRDELIRAIHAVQHCPN